jgi:uncharacterized repeat protein (TIGR03803 family)
MRNRNLANVLFLLVTTVLASTPASFAATYKVLHAFTGTPDGGGLFDRLAMDTSGNLYGTTWAGGTYGEGTVFELSPSGGGSWTEAIIHDFCADYPQCSDGYLPMRGLTLNAAGSLYGTTQDTVFELNPGDGTWSFSVIQDTATFDLIVDAAGSLYTETGPGKCNGGYVLKLKPPPDGGYWIPKDLYDFCVHNGQWNKGNSPIHGLSWDAGGNLYGVTGYGGTYNHGVVFQLRHTPSGWKEHVLHNFGGKRDGLFPYGGVVVDSAGNVYGSTLQGGSTRCGGPGCGTIYKVSKQPDGMWKETILFRFPEWAESGDPVGTLALDAAGNLYGVAGGGGNQCSCGVVFKLAHNPDDTWTYTILHRFHGTDGALPVAGVILDANGNIYGTTSTGGAGGYGVVFKIVP